MNKLPRTSASSGTSGTSRRTGFVLSPHLFILNEIRRINSRAEETSAMSLLHPANVHEHAELASCAQTVLDSLLQRDPEASPVFANPLPQKVAALRAMSLPAEGRPAAEVAQEMQQQVFSQQATVDHRRYFAFIPGPFSPLSWIGELLTAGNNPHAGSWLQSAGPSCIEGEMIRWMAGQLGFPAETSGGLFVSGGSMANLTAMAVARDLRLTEAARPLGVAYVSDQTHSSNAKGLKLLGFAGRQIRKIPSDANFRMDTAELRQRILKDRALGLQPFAVIATAGTTNTGSIDPLEEIAAIAREEGLWMHVDGAYGASICLSAAHRHLLKGIELADSVAWDAHKWMFQTYGCGAVLVREKSHLLDSFCVRPEYLRDAESNADCPNYWELGPELTRPARALRLWFTLQVAGTRAMGEAIAHGVQLGEWAQQALQQRPDRWEIISDAKLGIINFRYLAPLELDTAEADELQRKIARRAMEEGRIGVLTTELRGRTVLRMCSIHPLATEQDIRESIALLEEYGREAVAALREVSLAMMG
jgi:glutamate/tyrosine decarboxylase-like PLP-dependent enzyme